jgi:hypothetical protein
MFWICLWDGQRTLLFPPLQFITISDSILFIPNNHSSHWFISSTRRTIRLGEQFQGKDKAIEIDDTRTGGTAYVAFDQTVEKTDVQKKGQAFQGDKELVKTQASGQGYNAFPTESTAVPKKGKPWVPPAQRAANKIDETHTGGMAYEGIEGKGRK